MPEAPRQLSYREHQYVRVFVALAKRGGVGATKRELAGVVNGDHTSASLRTVGTVLAEMVAAGYVVAQVSMGEARQPWRFYVDRSAWQKGEM